MAKKQAKPVATNVANALFTKMSKWIIKAAKVSYYQKVYTTTQLMVKVSGKTVTYKVEQTAKGNVVEMYSGTDRNEAYAKFNAVPYSKCTYYNNRKEYTAKDGSKRMGAGWVTNVAARMPKEK